MNIKAASVFKVIALVLTNKNNMLVIKYQIEPGVWEELTLNTDKIAKWINAHPIDERLIIFNDVDLNSDKRSDNAKVMDNAFRNLLEMTEGNKLFTLLAELNAKAKEVQNKITKEF